MKEKKKRFNDIIYIMQIFLKKRPESSDLVPEKKAQKDQGQNVLWEVIGLQI